METITTQDYIKAIYRLETAGDRVTTSALAAQLGVSSASTTDMLKRLAEKAYVVYTPYKGVTLSAAGRLVALRIVRRHRLWEMFLVRHLGYSWDRVHEEAEMLEHVTSSELEEALDRALGHPATDPHGDGIPTATGQLSQTAYPPLARCAAGEIVRVRRVSDDNAHILQHAASLGVVLNRRLTIRKKMPFDGSMVVKVGKRECFISRQVADSIFVEPA
jgi:DtxR family Mn-dependent transcriptional regulator